MRLSNITLHKSRLWTIGSTIMLLSGCAARLPATNALASPERSPGVQATIPVLTAAKPAASDRKLVRVTYTPTTEDFLNPERGFHNNIELMNGSDFSDVRSQGYTLARSYIQLDEYRNRPLPAPFLAKLDRQFQLIRAAGIKVIPRFAYNFPEDNNWENSPDTSLTLAIEHIQQLKPLLQQNADVIAVFQAGFIGAWGEWHSSKNGLDRPESKTKILTALLNAVPSNRMVQLRYPKDIKANYPQSLTFATAHRGNLQARVGFKNDCFLSNQSDAGTYLPDPTGLKNYASKMAPFVAVGGETCQVTLSEQRANCPTATAELARYHWSYLNSYFYKPALDRLRQEGCYADISRKLGYRLQLVNSNFPAQVGKDRQLSGNFVIKNTGYASPYNPRNLDLILRHRSSGKVYRLPLLKPLSKTHDPRFWLPQSGEITVTTRSKLPPTAPAGVYELLLNLPDPMPKLANRPEYSIRLANDRVWEAKTGFNSLRRTLLLAK
jgi:hypothetical protein